MKKIKSFLNIKIAEMVTRKRALKATGRTVEDFNNNIRDWLKHKNYGWENYKNFNEFYEDGVFYFTEDFCKEGWCKTELRSILDTLFHLNDHINRYAEYWF